MEHCTDIFTGFRPDGEVGATQERYMLDVVKNA